MAESTPGDVGRIKCVADIMIPLDRYPWVRITDPLSHAVKIIENSELEVGRQRSLPRVLLVFDNDDRLAGLVRRRDIMRGLEPSFLVAQPLEYRIKLFEVGLDSHLSELSKEFSLERVVKGLRAQATRPVGGVLRPIAATLKPDDRIMKAIYEMVSLNESLIPVVEDDEVLGVVRSVDVFHELARLLRGEA
ncbi:MAG: CBS domain-containing protein [Gemmatimonadota bacterium]